MTYYELIRGALLWDAQRSRPPDTLADRVCRAVERQKKPPPLEISPGQV